ncbi:hypothetical protein QB910_000035 [Dabrowskivirus KKP3916]|uniref:Transglycosylase SLT domain-containing protein n=1 Tax=Alicyclobacillus phage KKP_3916 TaxID=3040651 RepID=A0AAT9V7I5_9CAUD|nr:hypothetical protein QB910_000035 [Alicyclobacillus phage KKP 3916]
MPIGSGDPRLNILVNAKLTGDKSTLQSQLDALTRDLQAKVVSLNIDPQALKVLNDFAQSFKSLNDILAANKQSFADIMTAVRNMGGSSAQYIGQTTDAVNATNKALDNMLSKIKEIESEKSKTIYTTIHQGTGRTVTIGRREYEDGSIQPLDTVFNTNNDQIQKAEAAVKSFQQTYGEMLSQIKESNIFSSSDIDKLQSAFDSIDASVRTWKQDITSVSDAIKTAYDSMSDLDKISSLVKDEFDAIGFSMNKVADGSVQAFSNHSNTQAIADLKSQWDNLTIDVEGKWKATAASILSSIQQMNAEVQRSPQQLENLISNWTARLQNVSGNSNVDTLTQVQANQMLDQLRNSDIISTTTSKADVQSLEQEVRALEDMATNADKAATALNKLTVARQQMTTRLNALQSNPYANQEQVQSLLERVNRDDSFSQMNTNAPELTEMQNQLKQLEADTKDAQSTYEDSLTQMANKYKTFNQVGISDAETTFNQLRQLYLDNISYFQNNVDKRMAMLKDLYSYQQKIQEENEVSSGSNGSSLGNSYRFKGYAFDPIDITKAMIGNTAFMGIMDEGQQFVQIQQDMAQLKSVLGSATDSQNSFNDAANAFISIAQQYGVSIDNVVQSATLWSRQYKDVNEVISLTNESTLLSVVDNMQVTDANKAVESSLNTLFGSITNANQAISDSTKLVDSWSAVSHEASVSATDLTEGFERAAAAWNQATQNGKNSDGSPITPDEAVDQLNALIAAGVRNTGRSGNIIGNMYKSVFANLDSGSTQVQQAVEALGVKYNRDDMYQMMLDLATAAQTATPEMSKYFETIAGGKYQYDSLRAALSNVTAIQDAYNVSAESSGSALLLAQNQIHTIGSDLQRLKDTIQSIMYNSSTGGLTSVFKDLVVWVNDLLVGLQNMPQAFTWAVAVVPALGLVKKAMQDIAGTGKGFFSIFGDGLNVLASGVKAFQEGYSGKKKTTDKSVMEDLVNIGEQNNSAQQVAQYNAVTNAIERETASINANVVAKLRQQEIDEALASGIDAETAARNADAAAIERMNNLLASDTLAENRDASAIEADTEATLENAAAKDKLAASTKAATTALEAESLANTEAATVSKAGTATNAAEEGVEAAGAAEGASVLSKVGKGLKSLGLGVGAALAPESLGTSLAIGAVVAGIGTAITMYGNWKQKSQELNNQIKSDQQSEVQSYQQNAAAINSLVSQYEKLDQETQHGTITSNAQALSQYYQVSQQLGQYMPTLIENIDAEGRTHLVNASAVAQEVAQVKALTQANVANGESLQQLAKNYEATTAEISKLEQETNSKNVNPQGGILGWIENKIHGTISPQTQQQDLLKIRQDDLSQNQEKTFMQQAIASNLTSQVGQGGLVRNDSNFITQLSQFVDVSKLAGESAEQQAKAQDDLYQAYVQLMRVNTQSVTAGDQYDAILKKLAQDVPLTTGAVQALSNALQQQGQQFNDHSTDVEGYATQVDNVLNQNKALDSAQQEIDQNGKLSQQTIDSLAEAYGSNFTNALAKGGAALTDWLNQEKKTNAQSILDDINKTKSTIQNTQERIKALQTEMEFYEETGKAYDALNGKSTSENQANAVGGSQGQKINSENAQVLQGYQQSLQNLQGTLSFLQGAYSNVMSDQSSETQKTTQVVDQYAEAIDNVNLALTKQQNLNSQMNQFSSQYRQGLQEEISLLQQKEKLLQEDIQFEESDASVAQVTTTSSSGSSSGVPQIASTNSATINNAIEKYAQLYNVPVKLIDAVITQESGFNQSAISGAGAIGLMQLMPSTAKSLGVNPYDAVQNIQGGVKYLSQLLQQFGGNIEKALAAYNAGAGVVEKYGGIPPYAETEKYVANIMAMYTGQSQPLNASSYTGGSSLSPAQQNASQINSDKSELLDAENQIQQLKDEIAEIPLNQMNDLVSVRNDNVITRWKAISQDYAQGSKGDVQALKAVVQWQENSAYWTQKQMDYINQEVKSSSIDADEKQKLKDEYEQLDTQLQQFNDDIQATRLQEFTDKIDALSQSISNLNNKLQETQNQMQLWEQGSSEYQANQVQEIADLNQSLADAQNKAIQIANEMNNTHLNAASKAQLKQDLTDALSSYTQAEDQILQVRQTVANQIVSAEKDAIQQQMTAMDNQYQTMIQNIDDEKTAYDNLISAQETSLQRTQEINQYNEKLSNDQTSAQKIQNQINALSMDNSAEGISQRQQLQDQLAQMNQQINDEISQQNEQMQQNALDDQKNNYDQQTSNQEEALQTQYNNAKQSLQSILDDTEFWNNQVTEIMEGNYKEASQTLSNLLGTVQSDLTDTNGSVNSLTTTFQQLGEDIAQSMGTAGASIQTNIIDELKEAEQGLSDLSLTANPNNTLTLQGQSSGSGAGNGTNGDSGQTKNQGVYTVKTPSGASISGTNFQNVVNQAGGQWLDGKWYSGKYINDVFVTSSKTDPPISTGKYEVRSAITGDLYIGDTQAAAVNAAGGQYIDGKWVAGSYVNGVFKTVAQGGKSSPVKLDTGGYTGDNISPDGALAILHSKELVLNATDTQNILKAVQAIREVSASSLNGVSNIAQTVAASVAKLIVPAISNNTSDNSTTTTIHMPVNIHSVTGDQQGAQQMLNYIMNQLKRKGVNLK